MAELSRRWAELSPEQQDEWKKKALNVCQWSSMPKKTIIRELKSAIEENVRIHSTIVVCINNVNVYHLYNSLLFFLKWGVVTTMSP